MAHTWPNLSHIDVPMSTLTPTHDKNAISDGALLMIEIPMPFRFNRSTVSHPVGISA